MSKRKRHSAEQVIRELGRTVAEAAKALGVSEPTFNRWRTSRGA